ncbi:MAG: alpha/beta hydrolase [Chitinophagaceae bacterium]|nr:alpha/beta hydrolase [Chitinophagaceae bacterium]
MNSVISQLQYRISGKGEPLVLLHGFGEDSHIWDQQVAALQDIAQIITPELPGTGQSPLPLLPAGTHLSIEQMADAVYALLMSLNTGPCTLLGHSMGGYITLAFAEKYPQMLRRFGLIHSTAFADSEEKKQNRLRGIEVMAQYGGQAFLKTTIPNLFGTDFKKEQPDRIQELINAAAGFDTRSLQEYYYAMRERPNRTAVLKSNPLPVLFVLGTEDVAAPLDDVLQQTHLPLLSYIHILDGVGHMGMWEATAAVNSYIRAFIQS